MCPSLVQVQQREISMRHKNGLEGYSWSISIKNLTGWYTGYYVIQKADTNSSIDGVISYKVE